jgi:hypothetical protein
LETDSVASCGVLNPPLFGIVQLTNSAVLRFRNWSFTINYFCKPAYDPGKEPAGVWVPLLETAYETHACENNSLSFGQYFSDIRDGSSYFPQNKKQQRIERQVYTIDNNSGISSGYNILDTQEYVSYTADN